MTPPIAGGLPSTMRAAVLVAPADLRIVEKPLPVVGPEDVLVKVAMCGTCGTDVALQEVPLPGQPPFGDFTPGHEWTGTVVGVGDTVDEVAIGDRVGIHVHRGCGRCVNCLRGSYTACLNYGDLAKGHRASGLTVDGGFAEYVAHHVSGVLKLPDAMSWEGAVLATTAGTAMYGFDRLGRTVAGETVVVIGPGPVGLMAVQVAKSLGAARVILVGTRAARLELGRRIGADEVIQVGRDDDAVAAVRRLTSDLGVDLVVETSGGARTPNDALRMLRLGGTLLFLAFYKEPVAFDIGYANVREIQLVTSRGEGRAAVARVLGLAARGAIVGDELVTHRYALDDIQQGFDDLRARKGDPVKMVFIP